MYDAGEPPGAPGGEQRGPSTALNPRVRSRRASLLVSTLMSPAYRAVQDRDRELERFADPPDRRMALVLVAASCLFLVLAAALGVAWSLGVAIACALAAAALAADAE